jgi:hypothetical protein
MFMYLLSRSYKSAVLGEPIEYLGYTKLCLDSWYSENCSFKSKTTNSYSNIYTQLKEFVSVLN